MEKDQEKLAKLLNSFDKILSNVHKNRRFDSTGKILV